MYINVNDIKNGMTIKYEGNIYVVLEFGHVKPGKGAAFVNAKLKNLRTGSITEERFNSGIKLEKAHVDRKPMLFLYANGDNYVFMDNNTYEQTEIPTSNLGNNVKFLKENLEITIQYYEGEIIGIDLPEKVEYKIIECEPAVKGNTTNNALKDAKIETGLVVKVPLFVENGESIIVSTKDGSYSSRA